MTGTYKNRKIRWGRELSEEEHAAWIAEANARETRVSGRNGLRMIGRAGPDPEWAALIEALAETGAITRADQAEAARSEWVKNFTCPGCGGSSGFARRDKGSKYDGIRITCGHRCRTRDNLVILGLRPEAGPVPEVTVIEGSNLEQVSEGQQSAAAKLRAAPLDTVGLDSIPEPGKLIAGLLHRNSVTWAVGKAGDGKSFVTLDMAGCVGTGMVWRGHDVTQGEVLFVAAEGVAGLRRRVRAWEEHWDRKMTGVTWLPAAVQAGIDEVWNALITVSSEIEPALIVIDTQARVTVGMEENSARDAGLFVDQLEKLRIATRACIVVVHHQGRSGDHARGSSAIDGAADTILQISKDEDLITIKTTKQKNIEAGEDIHLRLTPVSASAVLVLADGTSSAGACAATKMAAKWWALFRDDRVTATKLIDSEVATKTTFYRNVRLLLDSGQVVTEKAGRNTYYRLAAADGSGT